MPAVVFIHGRNGIGKTTVLRMLEGIMRLDFNPFRQIPFTSATLTFRGKKSIAGGFLDNGSILLKKG